MNDYLVSKKSEVLFEDAAVSIEYDCGSDLFIIQVTEFALNADESAPLRDVYDVKGKCEIHLNGDELAEVIRTIEEVKNAAERR